MNDDIDSFIKSVEVNFIPKASFYVTAEDQNEAKLAILKSRIRGKAASWLSRQPKSVSSSWNETVQTLKNKYDNPNRNEEKRRDSENKLLKLKQDKDSLRRYVKRANCINEDLSTQWDDTAAKRFILGIKDENTQFLIITLGQLGDTYTFAQVIGAAKRMLRTSSHKKKSKKKKKRYEEEEDSGTDSSAESEGDSSSKEESSAEESSAEESKRRTKKKKPTKKVVIDQDDLLKLLKDMSELKAKEEKPINGGVSLPPEIEVYAAQRQGYNDNRQYQRPSIPHHEVDNRHE